MFDEKYLNELHLEILDIMDQIDKICERHSIKYYLVGGTLLGAIRHKGFIPWDDDLDIGMSRPDFEAFIKDYYKELPHPYKLEWFNTNPRYNHIFAKVCNTSTIFEEEVSSGKTSSRGIFVDIFPFDQSNGYSFDVRFRKRIVNYLNKLICEKYFQEEVHGIDRILLMCFSARRLNYISTKVMKGIGQNKGLYYSNFGSQYNIRRQTHLIENFGEGIMLPFEDRLYRCPIKYEAVLTSIFGPDYMQLPPENKRKTHYPIKVVFSNGQEIVFGRAVEKLTIGKD